MSISMGLMLSIDTFPLAVAVPPLQQGISPARTVIEADKIVKPGPVAFTSPFNRSPNGGHQGSASVLKPPQLLTYSRQGAGGVPAQPVSGRFINIYA